MIRSVPAKLSDSNRTPPPTSWAGLSSLSSNRRRASPAGLTRLQNQDTRPGSGHQGARLGRRVRTNETCTARPERLSYRKGILPRRGRRRPSARPGQAHAPSHRRASRLASQIRLRFATHDDAVEAVQGVVQPELRNGAPGRARHPATRLLLPNACDPAYRSG